MPTRHVNDAQHWREFRLDIAAVRGTRLALASSWVSFLKQRLGPVAAAVKFVHWVCEEMDQRFAGYSV